MLEERKGKLGLALSGGGFCAAFFHIGVLARMADMGLLRHVEVISTVSGGSIIGALFYLHLKNMLEEKQGSEIKDEDCQDMLETIQNESPRGSTQHTVAYFSHPFPKFKNVFTRFTKGLCRRDNCLYMKQQSIKSSVKNAKIPIHMMNATSHNWVFTVSGMEETKRGKSVLPVDGNFKLPP
ncbi:patatin-like phospholipase family protein [Bacillus glycinifermentans]|nr:patatin-like phospholipase family protein [Bacillus glycinifermentans]